MVLILFIQKVSVYKKKSNLSLDNNIFNDSFHNSILHYIICTIVYLILILTSFVLNAPVLNFCKN